MGFFFPLLVPWARSEFSECNKARLMWAEDLQTLSICSPILLTVTWTPSSSARIWCHKSDLSQCESYGTAGFQDWSSLKFRAVEEKLEKSGIVMAWMGRERLTVELGACIYREEIEKVCDG